MDKSKNLDNKVILNNENYNKYENEKEENNGIIIELEIANNEKSNYSDDEISDDKKSDDFDDEVSNDEKKKEINILCDIEKLIKDNEENEGYYKKNNIDPPKEFNYFNKNNTKLYLNDKIDFC